MNVLKELRRRVKDALADLVVCNGGSLTTQQALAAGKPVLGIASNMDQFLNMGPIEAFGAGITLRADRVSASAIRQTTRELLGNGGHFAAAQRVSVDLAGCSAPGAFRGLIDRVLSQPGDAD